MIKRNYMDPTDDGKTAIQIESDNYQRRQEDGGQTVRDIIAELRLFSIDNSLPRSVNKEIEKAFEDVTRALTRGWWITAQEECEIVVAEGSITQEFKDKIYGIIVAYVLANY